MRTDRCLGEGGADVEAVTDSMLAASDALMLGFGGWHGPPDDGGVRAAAAALACGMLEARWPR